MFRVEYGIVFFSYTNLHMPCIIFIIFARRYIDNYRFPPAVMSLCLAKQD
jgi:hypothetical protein